MKRIFTSILVMVLLFPLCACGGTVAVEPTSEPLKFSENPTAIAEASESVVMLTCYDSKGEPVCTGSAFQCFEEGIYVTNYHVVEGITSIKANTESELYFDINEIVALSEEKDIAILKTTARPGVAVLVDGDSDELIKGENVVAIGSPQGFLNTVSKGTYSGALTVDDRNYIQFSAAISAGSSGGALFNDNGEVVGITSASYSEGQNLNFAVPINEVKDVWENKDDFSANVTEEQEFVAYTPTYIENHKDEFKSYEDFYVIGYYRLLGWTKDFADSRYQIFDGFNKKYYDSKDVKNFIGQCIIVRISSEFSNDDDFSPGDKVLVHCVGNTDDNEWIIDHIEITDLEPNNGIINQPSDQNTKPTSYTLDYVLEHATELGNAKVGNVRPKITTEGYISSIFKWGDNGLYYVFIVTDSKDVSGVVAVKTSVSDDSVYNKESKKSYNYQCLKAEIHIPDFETLYSPGDYVSITGHLIDWSFLYKTNQLSIVVNGPEFISKIA